MKNKNMSDDPRPTRKPPGFGWTTPLLLLAVIGLSILVTGLISERALNRTKIETQIAAEKDRSATVETDFRAEIETLKRVSAQREAEVAARVAELSQREAAIAGREDAATERTQSSFQGLLIQQNLLKNLEALQAGLPDMTPEVERLTREHAQFDAEVQRLRKENAELRRRLNSPAPLEGR